MLVNKNSRLRSNNSYHSIVCFEPIVFIYHLLPYEGKGIINLKAYSITKFESSDPMIMCMVFLLTLWSSITCIITILLLVIKSLRDN